MSAKQLRKDLEACLMGHQKPYESMYEAVSEQVMLLLLSARKLYKNKEYALWFDYHQGLLDSLNADEKQINQLFTSRFDRYQHSYYRDRDSTGLILLGSFFNGYDKGLSSLQSWNQLCTRYSPDISDRAKGRGRQRPADEAKRYHYLIDDFKNMLPRDIKPILPEARLGYSHQSLMLAHLRADEITKYIVDFEEIDHTKVLAESIYIFLCEQKKNKKPVPEVLKFISERSELKFFNVGESVALSDIEVICELMTFGNNENSKIYQEVDTTIKCNLDSFSTDDMSSLWEIIHETYARYVHEWLRPIVGLLRVRNHSGFHWKVSKKPCESDNMKFLYGASKHTFNIEIGDSTLKQLVDNHGVYDAIYFLADYLIGNIDNQVLETKEGSVSDYSLKPKANDSDANWKMIRYINSFIEWYQINKVLFIDKTIKREGKPKVNLWFAGLNAYDLKNGIAKNQKQLLKDILAVKSEQFGVSEITLKRYHSRVKKIIDKDIEILVEEQQSLNKDAPFNGFNLAFRPLWSDTL